MSEALISCLMVTANRPHFVERAIHCFELQTYWNRELVIIDDGQIDLSPIIERASVSAKIRYIRLPSYPSLTLGDLRNISIEHSNGTWCCQWDDDEWYHPHRLSQQMNFAQLNRVGASALKWTLMRIELSEDNKVLNFRADSGVATPGTILFQRGVKARYPSRSRNEDGVFLRRVSDEVGLAVMGRGDAHLFVRIFHGTNTWEMSHFLKRLRRRPVDWWSYMTSRFLFEDITRHKAFKLTKDELDSIEDLSKFVDGVVAI